jgi:exodeoxyribonuclease V gamma subunit
MAGLKIHLSPNLECAVQHYLDQKTEVRSTHLNDLFIEPSTVWLVNSPGTKRWLQQRFTLAQGIFTDQPIEYVGRYLWGLVAKCGAEFPDISPFEPTLSVWVIHQWLDQLSPQALAQGGYAAALASSLHGASAIEKHLLANELARLFDRYLLYRIEWLNRWQHKKLNELGAHERWQAELWRHLIYRLPRVQDKHPFFWLRDALGQRITAQPDLFADAKRMVLPSRLVLFGADGLPNLHWSALQWLSAYCTVDVYSFIVCDEFHQDIVSQRDQWRARLKDAQAAEYLEVGHPLLASWGRAQALAQASMLELNDEPGISLEVSEQNVAANITARISAGSSAGRQLTLLNQLQLSIAQMDQPRFAQLQKLVASDSSLSIFSATSHARQLAHLEDQLVEVFAADVQLQANEVLVISTDIETTRQLIAGLWKRVPYLCSDFTQPNNPWLSTWLDWVKVSSAQCTPAQALNLLAHDALRDALGMQADEPAQYEHWLLSAGVRVFANSAPAPKDQEPIEWRQTFDHGIERLLMGFASETQGFVCGVTEDTNTASQERNADWTRWPVFGIGEDHLESLERLCNFAERLQLNAQKASQITRMTDWIEWFKTALLFLSEKTSALPDPLVSEGIQIARDTLQEMEHHYRISGGQVVVDAAIAMQTLERHLNTGRRPAMPSGVVSVVQPESLNHVPYKIIAWLGCDDKIWPRQTIASRIDLMQQKKVASDPNQREQDKSIFLASLMNAQQKFWMFYTGRDARSGQSLNASPLVSELRSLLPCLTIEKIALLPKQLLSEGSTFSQRVEDFAWRRPKSQSLPDQSETKSQANRDTLVRFLRHPARFFLQQHQQLRQEWEAESLDEGLPWLVSPRDHKNLISAALVNWSPESEPDLQAKVSAIDFPLMPPAKVGEHTAQLAANAIDRVSVRISEALAKAEGAESLESTVGLKLVDRLNMRTLAPIVVDWVLGENELVQLFDLESQKLLQIQVEDEVHWQAREQLLEVFDLHQKQPLPLFKKCLALWILPVKKKATRSFAAVLGDPFDAFSQGFPDASDQWNQLLWRGQWPSTERVEEVLVSELSALCGLISNVENENKPAVKKAGEKSLKDESIKDEGAE